MGISTEITEITEGKIIRLGVPGLLGFSISNRRPRPDGRGSLDGSMVGR